MASLFYSTKNTRQVPLAGKILLRSDLPDRLTPQEVDWLLAHGICTLVDLRSQEEREKRPCPLASHGGFTYHMLPVTGGDQVPQRPEDVAISYIRMVDRQMERILTTIEEAPGGALYFCTAGKDRTGVVTALLLHRAGAERETIIGDYLVSGDNLRDVLTAYAAQTGIDPAVIIPCRAHMEQFLDGMK